MSIKMFKLLMIAETLLGVHRNYSLFPKFGRILIWLRIIVEIAFTVFVIILSYDFYARTYQSNIIVLVLNVTSSFSISLLALYHSKKFSKLISNTNKNHEYFVNDTLYHKQLGRTFAFVLFLIVNYLIVNIGFLLYANSVLIVSVHMNVFRVSLLTIYLSYCDMRYTFQYVVMYCNLLLLSEHVECISRRITKERLNFHENETDEMGMTSADVTEELTSFDEWTTVYMNIKNHSDLINSIFGVQITVLLTILTFFLITYLYSLTFMSVHSQLTAGELAMFYFKVSVYLMLLFALSRSAQAAQNNADKLRRHLGRLLIQSISDDNTFTATRDFVRLVSNRAIKTQAFGSIDIDMTLVPKFVMFFTSYTVIALQFNNVI